ncbi:hypothetical protein ACFYM2_06010 [Streptomyces sp. NPDC006711]|uniref:hypothetical protein n=1 Tax=unclassified Streptomyces TaxID=2593676 RepID=UPI0033DA3514
MVVPALPVVAVLGSAPVAHFAAHGLTSVGLTAHTWALPGRYSARKAAGLADSVPDWSAQLAPCDTLLTAFDHPNVLEVVMLHHLLPAVRPGALWIQIGPVSDPGAGALTDLSQRMGVACAQAPLRWSADGITAYGHLPSLANTPWTQRQADADLVYGAVIAGIVGSGFGGEFAPSDLPRESARDFILWDAELNDRPLPGRPDETAAERLTALTAQTHSEAVIAELIHRGLVNPRNSQRGEHPW